MNITKPVATRMDIETFAKLRQCLIEKGIPENKLLTTSNIVRTAMLINIAESSDPFTPVNDDELNIIKQMWKVTTRDKKLSLNELY